ncbi:MAG: glycerophosphodiester phosphodiesterase [Acidimicrobiales bacterium]
MQPLLPSPVGFAHRGGRAHGPGNRLATFVAALDRGAGGLESDVWLTADGVAVLDHDGVVRAGLRRRPISSVARSALPAEVASLEDLYTTCGTGFDLSLDVKDAAAAEVVVAVARAARGDALGRLWLAGGDWREVARWRPLAEEIHLVDSTRIRHMREGPERRAASLAEAGVDAVNLHASDWSGGLTTLFHRFERLCLGWDAQFERVLDELLGMGVDGVYSDHVDRLVASLDRRAGRAT